ncbi:DsbA family oxidoreductase [Acidisoma silvae]|uniref:DsbA family oxidoreductase n=1 Tax=Acidisoma silvae TaxID=2802396 RepID=A0A963YW41_9PROT|nr:DsbA family oxidoreductase [Acidisoma silvae]MCB8878226.1 DsbA family oxidoreductase [Acidisoma silvae]
MSTLKIDLYGDTVCPWCIIGQHRLDKVLKERFPGLAVDIEHHPVLLMPDTPPEGSRIPDLLKARYGVTDPSVAFARPHAEAKASGLDLDLNRQPYAYPTLDAHTLIRLARARRTQHALANAISHAYFMDARDISDADVLADIAVQHGFSRDEVIALLADEKERAETRREVARSAAAGVKSIPHFVFNGRLAINGGRSEAELAEAIRSSQTGPEAQ